MENVPFDALPAQATLAGDRSGRVIPTKRSNSAADSNAFSAHLQLRPHSAKTDENPAHGTACRKTDEFLGHDGTYRWFDGGSEKRVELRTHGHPTVPRPEPIQASPQKIKLIVSRNPTAT
jgi:hypothetical protein